MRDISWGVEAVFVTGLRVTNNRLEGDGSGPGIDVMDGVDSKIAMNTVGNFATGISVDTSGDSEVYDPATPGAVVTKTIPLASDMEGGALVATATNFAGLTSEFSYPVLFGQTDIVIDDSIDECQLD